MLSMPALVQAPPAAACRPRAARPAPHAALTVSRTAHAQRRGPVARASAAEAPSLGASTAGPSPAVVAKTVTDLVQFGTLCTICDKANPLGTYVSYVLDTDGAPILRLRKDAVHTANLNRDARCSLFVQPPSQPARSLARVTLVGSVAPVEHDRYEELAEMHLAVHGPGIGVDMMQPDDLFYRLEVDEVFYVGGMGSDGSAQVLPGADFAAAVPDGLYSSAEELVATWNERRADEVARIAAAAAKVPLSKLDWAELMWVDTNGIFLHLSKGDGVETVRVDFDRPAIDDRDARSKLTMLAQLAWEAENMDYRSMLPELLDNSANTN